MSVFDRIIGYETVRRELERICDALTNTEYYRKLGVSSPRGLLLNGSPGVGKTLMAECLIEASGRKAFLCRKDRPDGKFVDVIRDVFDKAARNTPSIVFMDDMDKYANDDNSHRNSVEFVTVQSCIDAARGLDIFVIATVNEIHNLPDSLIRPGRFDKVINVHPPKGKDAADIVKHYLKNQNCMDRIDCDSVAVLLNGMSCAGLETAVNKAGMLAAFERCEKIAMRHLVLGCLDVQHGILPESIVCGINDDEALKITYHESGHILVTEFLFPKRVSAACIFKEENASLRGLTISRPVECSSAETVISDAVCDMGGRAAVRQKYGTADVGSAWDMDSAYNSIYDITTYSAASGFGLTDTESRNCSDSFRFSQEQVIKSRLEECSLKAESIIAANRDLLEATAQELMRKGLLTAPDIQDLIRRCPLNR
ncbi:MAG: AAA family ATPase [Clostridia bacterium]|nr:AAA family ATPase [Clostridia bacterium]